MANTKIPVELSSTPGIVDNSNATAITIDSSENVGIGTTSPTEKLTLNGALAITGALSDDRTSTAAMDFSSGVTRFVSYGASGVGGQFAFRTASGGASSTERMRISSSGCVGVGSTVDRSLGTNIGTLVVNGSAGGGLWLSPGDSSAMTSKIYAQSNGSVGELIINNGTGVGSGGIIIQTNSSEKMRLNSSGRLLINATAVSAASAGVKMQINSDILSRGTVAGYFWENRSGITITSLGGWGGWYSTGTTSHFLYSDGSNIVSINRSSGAYTALSDRNKKKDFEDSTVGLAEVMQLQPKKFRMLDDADDAPKKLGFVAQDVENVIPEAYFEDTNEDASGVENTFIGLTDRPIIAALTKAIQEQQAQIEALQSEINLLKGE